MPAPVRIALIAMGAVLALAAPAAAAERCVDLDRSTCAATYDDVPAAVADADPGDTIVVAGEQSSATALGDGGKMLFIRGVPGAALLAPVKLTGDGSALSGVRVEPSSGEAAVEVEGVAARVDDVVVDLVAGSEGLVVRCTAAADGRIDARHVTVAGEVSAVAGRAVCGQPDPRVAQLVIDSSAFDGPTELRSSGSGTIATHFSVVGGDPQLDEDLRPLPGSPAIDAGAPAPLDRDEPFEDAAGLPRIADGNGDGELRRDAGAYERQPPPVPLPQGNVLANPGAEDGLAGWAGTYETAPFGDPFFPSAPAGAALGAGLAFFAGGAATDPVLTQRIGISASARAIDTGQATARLSGLLGGYGGEDDGDTVTVRATFLDPEGHALAPELAIGPVTPAERANVTTLIFRAAGGAIPVRTRAIDVTIAGHRTGTGQYTDAYADNLGLELSVPGVPVDPEQPIVPNLRPFAGITVLHPDAQVTRRGTVRVALACASATVRSCTGTLELRARLPRAAAPTRIARVAAFTVAPGRRRGVIVKLLKASRKALRRRTAIRATLRAVAADGQGVQRTKTVPLRLRLPRRR